MESPLAIQSDEHQTLHMLSIFWATKIMSELRKIFNDYGGIIGDVFMVLEVICFGFYVIGIYRKNRRLTLPFLVFYPIRFIYAIPLNFYHISYLLSEFNDDQNRSFVIRMIVRTLLGFVWMVLIWTTVFLYRRQLKEQNSDSSRMVVYPGENFYVNQADCE